MKKILAIITLLSLSSFASAQNFEIRINAGSAAMFVPDFSNVVLIAADGMVVPNFVHPSNSAQPVLAARASSTTRLRHGWFGEIEAGIPLSQDYTLSLRASYKQLKYDYNSVGTHPDFGYFDLGFHTRNFGETTLSIIALSPNLKREFLNSLIDVQAGMSVNYLLKGRTNNVLKSYELNNQPSADYDKPDLVLFDTAGKFREIALTANIRASVKILKSLRAFAAGEYYFTPLHSSDPLYPGFNYSQPRVKPFVLSAGLSVKLIGR